MKKKKKHNRFHFCLIDFFYVCSGFGLLLTCFYRELKLTYSFKYTESLI